MGTTLTDPGGLSTAGIGFRVPGSEFRVRGSRFEVRGSRFEVRGSRYSIVRGPLATGTLKLELGTLGASLCGAEPPSCDLLLFFCDELVPDLPVIRFVSVILDFGHLAADIDQGIKLW